MLVNELHSEKAEAPIFCRPSFRNNFLNLLQPLNAQEVGNVDGSLMQSKDDL